MNNVDRAVGIGFVFIAGVFVGVELTGALRPNRVHYLEVRDPPRYVFRIDCSAEGREACKVQSRMEKIVMKGKP